jgi:hypothetical protein
VKRRRVQFTATARRHVLRERDWWVVNREQAGAFASDLDRTVSLIAALPASRYALSGVPVVAGARAWQTLSRAPANLVAGRQRLRRLRGTFAPFLRASDRPIAIACFRLFTLVRRPRPDFSVPLFIRRMALRTFFCAPCPYLLRPFELRRVAIASSVFVGAAPDGVVTVAFEVRHAGSG